MLLTVCHWLQATAWARGISESLYLYPWLYTAHIFGFVILVTATTILNLRMLGWGMEEQPLSAISRLALPWAQAGFALQVTTGFLVFSSQAVSMYNNTAFRVKMLMVLLAGANVLLFQTAAYRGQGKWSEPGVTPGGAKFTAAASILIWFGIVAMSRVIGFTAHS